MSVQCPCMYMYKPWISFVQLIFFSISQPTCTTLFFYSFWIQILLESMLVALKVPKKKKQRRNVKRNLQLLPSRFHHYYCQTIILCTTLLLVIMCLLLIINHYYVTFCIASGNRRRSNSYMCGYKKTRAILFCMLNVF